MRWSRSGRSSEDRSSLPRQASATGRRLRTANPRAQAGSSSRTTWTLEILPRCLLPPRRVLFGCRRLAGLVTPLLQSVIQEFRGANGLAHGTADHIPVMRAAPCGDALPAPPLSPGAGAAV